MIDNSSFIALIVRATPILKLFEAVSRVYYVYQKIIKTAAVANFIASMFD